MLSRALGLKRSSPKIEIQLKGEENGPKDSYTTGSVVEGTVVITMPQNLPLGTVAIFFQGISQVRFYRAINHGRSKTQHTFLSLRQPPDEMKLPTPRISKKGQQYKFPFSFIIPEKLPPRSCSHFTQSEQIENSHRKLPATFGDRGCSLAIDGFASAMTCVSYRIRVKLSTPLSTEVLLTETRCVPVIPTALEEPPVEVEGNSLYLTQRNISLGKGLSGSQSGQLSVEVVQPKPVQLPSFGEGAHNNASTVATMKLEYVGVANPPMLRSISSGLSVITMYSATPWVNRPDMIYPSSFGHGNRGMHRDELPLSKLCIESVEWTRQPLTSPNQDMCPQSPVDRSDPPFMTYRYTASIVVPVTLPKTIFAPTFHSCFVSRVYLVNLSLCYHTNGLGLLNSNSCLRVPLQIIN
ncbi:hypothetical protein N7455_003724 [Penicillium solitum]|uniref:uncharacterized protein n=1 Tax=Penicillium solitum TaxID=60172 RepID=UPI0032C47E25|nr:hypothetical protein N7455_003724 [Penicillium solitum]